MKPLLKTILLTAAFVVVAPLGRTQDGTGQTVFTRGDVRVEFVVNDDGGVDQIRTRTTRTQGGRVLGYEVITRIPRSGATFSPAARRALAEDLLAAPELMPESTVCVSIETGKLRTDEDGGSYVDIVLRDCEGNILSSDRREIAAVPAAADFSLPVGNLIPNIPQQGESSPDGA